MSGYLLNPLLLIESAVADEPGEVDEVRGGRICSDRADLELDRRRLTNDVPGQNLATQAVGGADDTRIEQCLELGILLLEHERKCARSRSGVRGDFAAAHIRGFDVGEHSGPGAGPFGRE